MADFTIKKGDRLPLLTATLYDASGPANLTGATVAFKMQLTTGGAVITGSATIVSASAGTVEYAWGASDTATAGTYNAEFVVTLGGKEWTFPNDTYLSVVVMADVS